MGNAIRSLRNGALLWHGGRHERRRFTQEVSFDSKVLHWRGGDEAEGGQQYRRDAAANRPQGHRNAVSPRNARFRRGETSRGRLGRRRRGWLGRACTPPYPEACERLQKRGIAGLRLHYRKPNDLVDCILDTLCGVEFLVKEGAGDVALVGHSFGGAVVISAAAVSPHVKAVVPLSSQTYGTDLAPKVTLRPMLLIHGTSDDVLPPMCSRQIFAAAKQPKEIKLYEHAGHGLNEVRQEVLDLLLRWLPEKLGGTRHSLRRSGAPSRSADRSPFPDE